MIRSPYVIEPGRVLCDGVRIDKADPATFEALAGEWGRDASRVYCRERRMKADHATFEALSNLFARDKDNVYEEIFRVRGADPATFEVLAPERPCDDEEEDGDYARDKEKVFFKGAEKAVVVRNADPGTFRALGWRFGRDASHVFWERTPLPECDVASWERLERYYSRDQRRVYYVDRPIAGADPRTFEVLPGAASARDANRFYAQDAESPPEVFWSALGRSTVFVGSIESVTVASRRLDVTIRIAEVLHPGAARAVPAAGSTLATSLHLEQDQLAGRWTGLSRIWFAEEQRQKLTPAFHWRTFWPIERRGDVERLLAERPR